MFRLILCLRLVFWIDVCDLRILVVMSGGWLVVICLLLVLMVGLL